MKKILILFILTGFCITLFAQDQTPKVKFEYASVYIRINYQGNLIVYDNEGISKSPLLSLPNGTMGILEDNTDPDNPKKFSHLTLILNYMASFDWCLKSSTMLPYLGGEGVGDRSKWINTNEYAQFLIFERKVQ